MFDISYDSLYHWYPWLKLVESSYIHICSGMVNLPSSFKLTATIELIQAEGLIWWRQKIKLCQSSITGIQLCTRTSLTRRERIVIPWAEWIFIRSGWDQTLSPSCVGIRLWQILRELDILEMQICWPRWWVLQGRETSTKIGSLRECMYTRANTKSSRSVQIIYGLTVMYEQVFLGSCPSQDLVLWQAYWDHSRQCGNQHRNQLLRMVWAPVRVSSRSHILPRKD